MGFRRFIILKQTNSQDIYQRHTFCVLCVI